LTNLSTAGTASDAWRDQTLGGNRRNLPPADIRIEEIG
jgi:hypothetical protein